MFIELKILLQQQQQRERLKSNIKREQSKLFCLRILKWKQNVRYIWEISDRYHQTLYYIVVGRGNIIPSHTVSPKEYLWTLKVRGMVQSCTYKGKTKTEQ